MTSTTSDSSASAAVSRPRQPSWWALTGAAVVLALAGVALGEWLGWPFLAAPLERVLSSKLERQVRFSSTSSTSSPSPTAPGAAQVPTFRIRFVGGVRLQVSDLEIAAPAWSQAEHMVLAHDVSLTLRYVDLWRATQGAGLRIQRLKARSLDAELQRLADGRASWQFHQAEPKDPAEQPATPLPRFAELQVIDGAVRYRDASFGLDLDAHLSLTDRQTLRAPVAASASASTTAPASSPPGSAASATAPVVASPSHESRFKLTATGRYRGKPVKVDWVSTGQLDQAEGAVGLAPMEVNIDATVGQASLAFQGSTTDPLRLESVKGRFTVKGPSLAAVGDPIGVTLPTTGPFRSQGNIAMEEDGWHVTIADATVGSSRLRGNFVFDNDRSVPKLTGQLQGTRLMLADLAPVIGVVNTAAPVEASGTEASDLSTATAPTSASKTNLPQGRVLPNRPFDLPSMRAMDADVQIDINEVDLNTSYLQPLRPLRTRLRLEGGVLTLDELDARTAQGRLMGDVSLDGRGTTALWRANLRWGGVQLEQWIRQARTDGSPPYISGRMNGKATLQGQGRSTADILGSLRGGLRTELREGTISHLLVEEAGLDLAESLGLLIRGDKSLSVRCAVADLVVQTGVLRPRVMVLDTSDSVVWIDGMLSLASETMDLRAVVSPKDFSPLTLRTPLHVGGSFASPKVSLNKEQLTAQVASSLLLGLLNPLAALIPFIDRGDPAAATRAAAGCQSMSTGAAAAAGSMNPRKP